VLKDCVLLVASEGRIHQRIKQLAEKVRKEIAPALRVRVHEVRGLARGGAVIRTPSSVELKRVMANKNFGEAGLEIKQTPELKPKIVVSNVDTAHTPEDFMTMLYNNNFVD